jgi:beta-galactosidase
MVMKQAVGVFLIIVCSVFPAIAQTGRTVLNFNKDWKFHLQHVPGAEAPGFADAGWRTLSLPHDWSIELPFDKKSPAGTGGGALNGGIGWYRKSFTLPATDSGKIIFIEFDGVYRNSEVWINGHYLGKRPNGYISFRYELTPWCTFGAAKNIIAVKVNNDQQPNSRWYSGSGIYRNVWLTKAHPLHVDRFGSFITTPAINDQVASVQVQTRVRSFLANKQSFSLATTIYTAAGKKTDSVNTNYVVDSDTAVILQQNLQVNNPELWSTDNPRLYKAVSTIRIDGKITDRYETSFGIRYFKFDAAEGFLLNGKPLKINGVCNHHDLGCLGTAINTRALQRQLEILKAMGCNGIRTAHNPPAPELLALCDAMGFIVMDESFDMWKRGKSKYDYHLDWDTWHVQDLMDHILRDRNHPSVFMWSVGNEILEQWGNDSSSKKISHELAAIVKSLDTTRPVVSANNETRPINQLLRSGAFDMIGYNYHHTEWDSVMYHWGHKPFIVTESVSALQSRGHYDMPSDSIRRWPQRWDLPLKGGNPDTTCSAYDNCAAPWGSTHEETMKEFRRYKHIAGMYIWTGFDYIGEPTPYAWPARSSYFGIIDLAGFPKDVYYMYQSEWTNKPVLHIFPHWNWKNGDTVDVWAYYSQADEVELFLNNTSLGVRKKQNDQLHVVWRVPYQPGTLHAVSRLAGKIILTNEIKTAAKPARIILEADRKQIQADGTDQSFVTVKIVDAAGNVVPDAGNLVQFTVRGKGFIAGVDNGSQTSMESFKASERKAFNGLCLAVIQSNGEKGTVQLTATSKGLAPATVIIKTN